MWKMIFQARRNVSHWTVGKVGVISSRWNPRHLFIKSFLTEFILDSMGLLRKMYNISILNPRLPLPVLTLCFFTFPLSFCLFGFGFLGVFWFFFFSCEESVFHRELFYSELGLQIWSDFSLLISTVTPINYFNIQLRHYYNYWRTVEWNKMICSQFFFSKRMQKLLYWM